jgi:hypothetical protein
MKNLVKLAFVAVCVSMMAVSCAPKTEEAATTATDSTVQATEQPAAAAAEVAPADTTTQEVAK